MRSSEVIHGCLVFSRLFYCRRRIKVILFFFSSRRRHTRCGRDWSSDVCSSDLAVFKSKFQEMPRQKDQDKDKAELIYWKGKYIKSIASNDSLIHAKIQFTLMQNHQDLDSSSIYYGKIGRASCRERE